MQSISPLIGISPSGSSTSESAGRGKHYQPQQGQIFKALVLEAKSRNTFVLDIGGNKIPAQTKVPLSAGQTLQLQVAATKPQIELRILSDSANLFSGKSITLLGSKIDIQSVLNSMRMVPQSALEELASSSKQTLQSFSQINQESLAGKGGGDLLKQLIERLGISLEAMLARGNKNNAQHTLKAALLDIAHIFKGADKLAENTNRILNTLELYQLAQLQLDKENLFIFPLPIPFLEKGYLVVENNRSTADESEENDNRYSLHLTLEGLGNLQIDILKNSEGLYLRFVSNEAETLQFIKQFEDDLMLNMINTTILGVSFAVENIDPASDLVKRLLPDGTSIVNTTA